MGLPARWEQGGIGEEVFGVPAEADIVVGAVDADTAEQDEGDDVFADLDVNKYKGDNIGVYLRQAGRRPLLNAEQEVELAKAIEAGVLAREKLDLVADGQQLDPALARDLRILDRQGKIAFDNMLESNLRLVISLAKRYTGKGVPFLDLIQEGNLGLIRAVEKFDHAKGYKFSTYATLWIRQAITRGMAQQFRMIRLPTNIEEGVNKMERVQRDMMQRLGRDPTPEEVAEEMGITAKRVSELRNNSRTPVSIDAVVSDDGDSAFGDFIADSGVEAGDLLAWQQMLARTPKILKLLDEGEATVIGMRFGVIGGKQNTPEQIGPVIGCTRERVRQIEARAMRKLRRMALAGQLDHVTGGHFDAATANARSRTSLRGSPTGRRPPRDKSDGPEQVALSDETVAVLEARLRLMGRPGAVLLRLYGIGGAERATPEQVASFFGLTVRRIVTIESQALSILSKDDRLQGVISRFTA